MEPKVLIVEDNEDDWRLVHRAFLKAGDCVLHWAKDGKVAIERLSDEKFVRRLSLIICDLKMPGVSGFDCLEFIKGQKRLGRIPVVVLTSSNQESDRKRAKELGADFYLVKPGRFEELVEIAKRLDEWARKRSKPQSPNRCRVIVRNSKTRLFFQGATRWTRSIEEALDFEAIQRAVRFCRNHSINCYVFAF